MEEQEQKISFYEQRTIRWDRLSNAVVMIDQTLLPLELKFIECRTVGDIIDAIKSMKIRGAPAIGVAGAMGVALSVFSSKGKTSSELMSDVRRDSVEIRNARPTAVNLAWGVESALEFQECNQSGSLEKREIEKKIVEFVEELAESDVKANKKLSSLGAQLFRNGDSVLTHCK